MYRLQKTGFLVAMLAIGLATAAPVKAERVDTKLNYGHIWGEVTVHKDVVDWKLNLRDTKPNDKGVFGVIYIDLNNKPDPDFTGGFTSGGQVRKWNDKKRGYFPVRGARLELCEEGQCREVAYIPEK